MPFRRTPLAWRSITHDKKRLLLSLGGIMFATILMFTQLGFLNALFDSQVALIQYLNADVFIVNRSKQRMGLNEPLGRRRLEQARQVEGVAAVYPLYLEGPSSYWKNPETGKQRAIRTVGLDPDDPVFQDDGLSLLCVALRKEDTALMDSRSKSIFGPRSAGLEAELSGRRVRIAGTFSLGTDFDYDGTVLVSEQTFLKIFPERGTASRLGRVELGLVRLKPGYSPAQAASLLNAALPNDAQALSREELMSRETAFWRKNSPVGFIFGIGLVIGFIVGVVICSQIVYTNVLDRLPLFGTLKAIGYTNGYLIRLVALEAVLLSVLAFVPGLLIAQAIYSFLSWMTGISMFLTAARILLIFAMTVGMALAAAAIALFKAITADPAEVFK